MTFDLGAGWSSQRRKPLARTGRLRPVSAKRAKVNRARTRAVKDRFGDRPACHACGPLQLVGIDRARTGCNGWAADAHEITRRSRDPRDDNLTDPDGILPVSRACHDFINANDEIARAAGLSLPSRDHLR